MGTIRFRLRDKGEGGGVISPPLSHGDRLYNVYPNETHSETLATVNLSGKWRSFYSAK